MFFELISSSLPTVFVSINVRQSLVFYLKSVLSSKFSIKCKSKHLFLDRSGLTICYRQIMLPVAIGVKGNSSSKKGPYGPDIWAYSCTKYEVSMSNPMARGGGEAVHRRSRRTTQDARRTKHYCKAIWLINQMSQKVILPY